MIPLFNDADPSDFWAGFAPATVVNYRQENKSEEEDLPQDGWIMSGSSWMISLLFVALGCQILIPAVDSSILAPFWYGIVKLWFCTFHLSTNNVPFFTGWGFASR